MNGLAAAPPGAALWRGSAASVINLNPQATLSSGCSDVHGTVQVGVTGFGGGVLHAALWKGTPESWVDLHPTDYLYSLARSTDEISQVGYASFTVPNYGSFAHAGLWKSTAESWVDLHPPKYKLMETYAEGVHNGQQVGSFYNVGNYQACMWEGTAESFKFIHPAGYSSSGAWGVYNGIQVGVVWRATVLWMLLLFLLEFASLVG